MLFDDLYERRWVWIGGLGLNSRSVFVEGLVMISKGAFFLVCFENND